ncbi:transposase [Streptomyces angustmyceticus]|uniref:transposase n=1 Tax=Streptomyces angustmyceticus TaxID=285578 RepID=UPI003F57B94A
MGPIMGPTGEVLPSLPTVARRLRDRRKVFDGVWWRARPGSPWRDIPERYGPWETAYALFRRWQIDGSRPLWPGTSSGRCPSTPRSAAPTSTPPGLAKKGSRSGPDASGRPAG